MEKKERRLRLEITLLSLIVYPNRGNSTTKLRFGEKSIADMRIGELQFHIKNLLSAKESGYKQLYF